MNPQLFRTALLLAGLQLSPVLASTLANSSPAAQDTQTAAPIVVTAELERALDGPSLDADALYTAACAVHGHVGPLIEEIDLLIADEAQPAQRRRSARWARALLQRRRGEFKDALETLEPFAQEEGNVEARLQQAELLDASGRLGEAVSAYEELLPMLTDEERQSHVHLRLALLQMEQDSELKDALATYAKQADRDKDLRNRAAVVLALIDRPADAIELYTIDENADKPFRHEVRLAEWSIRAGDAQKAQEFAWRAARSATLKRDRFYGLTILVEAHRLDDSIDALVDKFASTPDLDVHTRGIWIELLRERGRYDEAIALYTDAKDGDFSIEERRQLLEMYREKGDEETMIQVYKELIAESPTEVFWREGLSRAWLERGERKATLDLWAAFLADPRCVSRRLEAAMILMDLGLDDLAIQAAELCIAADKNIYAGMIFLFGLHKDRGQLDLAEAALERMEASAPPGAAERFQLADSWEQLGRQDRAVQVLERVREARGADESGEDLEMRLAWLYSEIGEEETALERWREIWTRINAISRRRYAEDRMMTVASRLGSLADIAIDLEKKLVDGSATERESGLLVRLYVKVNDPVSASEVIDEFMKQSGGSELDTLQEKGRVYLACNDYYNYEKVVRQLIEIDKEGEGDYLRQLAMSQLERGKPDEARVVLARLKELEVGSESAEFEAGVLALAGMREEAIQAYRKGIATNPGRIESYLLMANLMKDMGQTERAVGMFQHLAETATKDDLFTIAIDGLLNVEAPKPVMQWARRITLERLAQRHDKMYLYQLLSDLAEQVDEREGMLTALENSLPISGERRPSVLRELMDLAKPSGRQWKGDDEKHLAYGRRLIGLSEIVPPQVYLDLGEAFLKADDPTSATKTFRLASDLPDYPAFQRRAAGLFESTGFRKQALDIYKRVLVAQSSDVSLMVKVGELEEQGGRDEVARGLYDEALALLFSRQPLSTLKAKKEVKRGSFFAWFGSRNIDDFDKHYERLLKNLLVVLPDGEALETLLAQQNTFLLEDLTELASSRAGLSEEERKEQRDTLDKHPRLRSRANFYRRLTIATKRPELANDLDLAILAAFPDDADLLESLCQKRVDWGLYGSVRQLLDEAPREAKLVDPLRFLVGDALGERSARRLPIDQANGLFLPLLMRGELEEASVVLRRTDFTDISREDLPKIEPLFSASLYLGAEDLILQIGREWTRLHVKHNSSPYQIEPVLQKCKNALDADGYRNLCMSLADQVIKQSAEGAGMLAILPKLQEGFDDPLVTEEQVMELLDNSDGAGRGYGMGPVILLLPEASRGAALRTVWGKIKADAQAAFLLDLVGEAEQELGDAISEFVAGSLLESLREADRIFSFYVTLVVDAKYNKDLALKMLDIMIEHDPNMWHARSGRAQMLSRVGRTEEAVAEAVHVYAGLLNVEDSDYEKRNAREQILREFLPEQLPAFSAVLDDLEAKQSPTADLTKKRLDLLKRAEDKAAARLVLEQAVTDFPKELDFIDQLQQAYAQEGKRAESLALLERAIEIEPKRRQALLGFWGQQQNPIQALAAKQLLREEQTEKEKKPAVDDPFAGMMVISAAGIIQTNDTSDDRPTIGKVKDAVLAEDWSLAQTSFRQLWRKFPKGETQARSYAIFFGGSSGRQGVTWPKDETEVAETEQAPSRGGLENWKDELPENDEKPLSAYDVLAEYEFGVDEMQRLLRSKSASELDSQRDVFKGLLRARILKSGEQATLKELMAIVREGRAGKLETTMLLTLLDEHPDLRSAETASVLDDLARSVRPMDIGPLRSLARVQARQGNTTEARRLYKWLATRTDNGGYSFNDIPTISQRELLKDVQENLEGEERLAVIDAVIQFADPGDNAWQRESFEQLVLDIYMELLEPAVAFERSRAVLEQATDFSAGMRRNVARLSTALWAQNGYNREALKCLEYGICSLDADVVQGSASWWSDPTRPGWWSDADLRRLFPKDGSKFVNYGEWLLAAKQALSTWRTEERVRGPQTLKALVLIHLRLAAAGNRAEALTGLQLLAEDPDLERHYRLWIVDALRECGDEALANSMERADFDSSQLHLERVHEVVRRELEANGPQAAIDLGAPQTEFTLNERLLDVLVEAAQAGQLPEQTERWTLLRSQAQAARERLKEIEAEEKLEAEAEKKKAAK